MLDMLSASMLIKNALPIYFQTNGHQFSFTDFVHFLASHLLLCANHLPKKSYVSH